LEDLTHLEFFVKEERGEGRRGVILQPEGIKTYPQSTRGEMLLDTCNNLAVRGSLTR